jgi:hypothetical protein
VNATEALCEARKHGAVFIVSGEDCMGVAAPMRLPGSLISDRKIHKAQVIALLEEEPDYSATACTCGDSTGLTGSNRCGVCALPLICPHCSGCRGCKRMVR